jgi:hypothetical protein
MYAIGVGLYICLHMYDGSNQCTVLAGLQACIVAIVGDMAGRTVQSARCRYQGNTR